MVNLTKPARGTKDWHTEMNENFQKIEDEFSATSGGGGSFDQSLNSDDDVVFATVNADNLDVDGWDTARERMITTATLEGTTLKIKRANSPTIAVDFSTIVGAIEAQIPNQFKYEIIEINNTDPSGEVAHSLGMAPWGAEVWVTFNADQSINVNWTIQSGTRIKLGFSERLWGAQLDQFSTIPDVNHPSNLIACDDSKVRLAVSDQLEPPGTNDVRNTEEVIDWNNTTTTIYLWGWSV